MRQLRTVARSWLALLCALLVAGCGDPEVEVRLDEGARQAFAGMPGTIGIRVETLEEKHFYALRAGALSPARTLPEPPKKAAAISAGFSGPDTLPASAAYDYRPPYMMSPDEQLMAVVVIPQDGRPEPRAYTTLAIVRIATGEIAALIKGEKHKRIMAVAWSGDSSKVGVLRGSSKAGKGPMEFIASLSGHGVSYTTYFLEIFDTSGAEIGSSELTSNVRASWGSIVWFDEAASGDVEEGLK